MDDTDPWKYPRVKQALQETTPPLMAVNLEALKRNVDRLTRVARDAGKSLRVASKSVRVPRLLKIIRDHCGEVYGGLMTFSPAETVFLHERGFSDFLLAYPRVQDENLRKLIELHENNASTVRVMVDEPAHLEAISRVSDSTDDAEPLPVCIDLDVSYRPGNLTHIGVRRSPIRTLENFKSFYREVKNCPDVTFDGVMGYEAQEAGVPDDSPFHPLQNPVIRLIKNRSQKAVSKKRRKVSQFLNTQNEGRYVYNAGGTGCIRNSVREDWVTEVTAGSGFLQSHLFDYYRDNENEPAFCFGLPVTRKPEAGVVTCQSGGFIASGPPDRDKAPVPFRPEGLETYSAEGFGEVQTPLKVPEGTMVDVGDPLFFRPAKAGEIAEQFNEYCLLKHGSLTNRAPTYRGFGKRFF